jgi:hypothetical protein
MSLQYQLKEGSYHLYDLSSPASEVTGEHRLRLMTDNVAIAFDLRTGELQEHGSPARIHSWASNTRRRSGPLPVDEINKCLRITGYCGRMFSRLATLPHGKRLPRPH